LTVAVAVFEAGVAPKVRVDEDSPLPSVEFEELDRLPPPAVTAQSTVKPGTGFELESLTTATKELTAVPTTPDCSSPDETVMLAGAPGLPVALKFVVIAVPFTVALTVFAPAVVPVVRVDDAIPDAFVELDAAERFPPPPVTAQSIVTEGTTLLFESLTTTVKGLVRALPAVAIWALPAETAMEEGAPGAPVALKFVEKAVPSTVAMTVLAPTVMPVVRLI
jgi:hypothetical protein